MKYKFSVPVYVRGFVEWQLEHYHEDKRQLENYKEDMIPSPTQAYSLTAGVDGGEVGRSTENVAFHIMTDKRLAHLERSCAAIDSVIKNLDDADKKLIELVYWRREYTPEGAGLVIGMSTATAYRHINTIITAIAHELGIVGV